MFLWIIKVDINNFVSFYILFYGVEWFMNVLFFYMILQLWQFPHILWIKQVKIKHFSSHITVWTIKSVQP